MESPSHLNHGHRRNAHVPRNCAMDREKPALGGLRFIGWRSARRSRARTAGRHHGVPIYFELSETVPLMVSFTSALLFGSSHSTMQR